MVGWGYYHLVKLMVLAVVGLVVVIGLGLIVDVVEVVVVMAVVVVVRLNCEYLVPQCCGHFAVVDTSGYYLMINLNYSVKSVNCLQQVVTHTQHHQSLMLIFVMNLDN